MHKEKIISLVYFLLFSLSLLLVWLSMDFHPLIFDMENTILELPKAILGYFMIVNCMICILICYYYWQHQYFDCQHNYFPPTKIEFFSYILLTFISYSIPILLILISGFIYINGKFDNSEPYTLSAIVIVKKYSCGHKNTNYRLTLKQANQSLIFMDVSKKTFENIQLNDNITIIAKRGLFNITWRQSFYIQ